MLKTKVFKSGLRLIVQNMPGYDSASFNMYVSVGSQDEDDTNRGISHFIEHMLFKGTKNRTALEIVTKLDAIGASVNAYTSQTETVYYTKSVRKVLPTCVDIISDMLFDSTFDQKEINREKKVVVEEISMYNDSPSSKVQQIAGEQFYKGTPLGYDVGGTKTSVRGLNRQKIDDYMAKHYVPEKILLSFAGNITFEEAEKLAYEYFEKRFKTKNEPYLVKTPDILTLPKTKYVKRFKDNEQSHVYISFPGVNLHDPRYHALAVFNTIWGSNMSSRLFQIIREKLGLVYFINSSPESSNWGGSVSIHLGTNSRNLVTAISALAKAIKTVVEEGVTLKELDDAKTNLINTHLLQYENTAFVSLYNAKSIAKQGFIRSKEETVDLINNVTKEDVNSIAGHIYGGDKFVIAQVGRDQKTDLLKHFKK